MVAGNSRGESVAKRRGNPNWGKPEPNGPVIPAITEFDRMIRQLNLRPDQYIRSVELREWASRNKNSKFIPQHLLEEWGFEVDTAL